jgi:signal transduction histidine kinase
MHVDYSVSGAVRPVPRLVDGSAYRIVQESLTNVARHSIDARTSVVVRYQPQTLILEISDDGGRPASSASTAARDTGNGNANASNGNGSRSRNKKNGGGGGRGLILMRERVAVLGGKIETGPLRNGYSVVAELPLEPV